MTMLARPPLQEELWWSCIARHFATLGITEAATQQRWTVNNRGATGSPLFPRQIKTATKLLAPWITAEQIIRDHTVLPFLMPFLDCHAIEKATCAMETHGHVEFFLGLAAMPSYPTHLRRCRKCSNFYRTKFGAVPWLRVHQLPGVAICPEHGVPLELSDVSARANIQIRKFVAADSPEIAFNRVCLPAFTFSHMHYLSKSAQELLASNVPRPGPGRLGPVNII